MTPYAIFRESLVSASGEAWIRCQLSADFQEARGLKDSWLITYALSADRRTRALRDIRQRSLTYAGFVIYTRDEDALQHWLKEHEPMDPARGTTGDEEHRSTWLLLKYGDWDFQYATGDWSSDVSDEEYRRRVQGEFQPVLDKTYEQDSYNRRRQVRQLADVGVPIARIYERLKAQFSWIELVRVREDGPGRIVIELREPRPDRLQEIAIFFEEILPAGVEGTIEVLTPTSRAYVPLGMRVA